MKLTHDTLVCILRECNLETIERFLMMNHELREWILANRKSYARIPVQTIYIEADAYSETNPWNIQLVFTPSNSITVQSSQIEKVNLSHFCPSRFEYRCLTRNEPFEVSHDQLLEKTPKEWFRELESVYIAADNIEMARNFYDEKLKLFASLRDLEINGYLPYSHLSEVLDLMQSVRSIRIRAHSESDMVSQDDDLNFLMEKADKLESLTLKNVKSIYTAEKFIEFLKDTSFAESVKMEFSDWPEDGETVYRFFKYETDLSESVFLPITRYHEDNPPVLPHRYSFLFRKYRLEVTSDAVVFMNEYLLKK